MVSDLFTGTVKVPVVRNDGRDGLLADVRHPLRYRPFVLSCKYLSHLWPARPLTLSTVAHTI